MIKLFRTNVQNTDPAIYINPANIVSMTRQIGSVTKWDGGASQEVPYAYTAITMSTIWEGNNEVHFVSQTPEEILELMK